MTEVIWEAELLPFEVQEADGDDWLIVSRFEHEKLAIADAKDRARGGAYTRVVQKSGETEKVGAMLIDTPRFGKRLDRTATDGDRRSD